MNVLLVGSGAAGLLTFKRIAKTGHRVTAVLSSPAPYEFRGASLVGLAEIEGVPVWPGALVKEPVFGDVVQSHQVDILLNVNSLYRIRAEVLQAPRIGAFNFHPGPLPDYAGLNAPSWALFNGETSHGVTVHWMVPTIDAGPIAYQATFPVVDQDTCATVSFKCAKTGVSLIDRLLRDIERDVNTIPRMNQDLAKRRYFSAGPPQQGYLRWATSARAIVNFLRACEYRPFPSPWGHPRTTLDRTEVCIATAQLTGQRSDQSPGVVGQVSDTGALVACADEWLLVTEVLVGESYQRVGTILRAGARFKDISETEAGVVRHGPKAPA
jgi:UDP-4-amino-4-deoxy-L-arabinose formyltransferase/UDP-glucuronic acid dehydrogenase (UDP-4-keto-hexauronic acid decarboxylating)